MTTRSSAEGVRRVVPMVLGWEHLPLWISMPLAEHDRRDTILREPVPGLLLECDGGWILLDSGFNAPLVRDRYLRERFWGDGPVQPELAGPDDRDPLDAAFELAGVDPRDVVAVCLSHFHNDHSGGIRHFVDQCPVYVQRAEYEYAMTTDPGELESVAMFRIDFDDRDVDWRLLDGDTEIAPGLTAISTAGHTPGHQSFKVDLDPTVRDHHASPGYLFAFDAADLRENIDLEQPVSAYGRPHEDTIAGIRRLKSLAGDRGYRIVPGHDPVEWPALAHELGVPIFE
jgi:N-acyl homoserine lactone hydrolase